MSNDMLSNLARAVLETSGGGSVDDPADGEYARKVVRAILECLSSPTEGMLRAAYDLDCWGQEFAPPEKYWQAMLSHVLNERRTDND